MKVFSRAGTLKFLINEETRINKYGGKNGTLLVYLLSKSINAYSGIFSLITLKIESMVAKNSKKAKRACSFIKDFRVIKG